MDTLCIFKAAETCPAPVRNEAARRGWRIELLPNEIKTSATCNNVSLVASERSSLRLRPSSAKHDSTFTLVWRNSRFTSSEFKSAVPSEKLNHFPNSKSITKKDLLVRGIRKMQAIHGRIYNFTPQAFILPSEYTKFVKQYASDEEDESKAVWICKPSDLSRGRKIFLLRELGDLHYDQQCVIQKYVPNPLTIGGYKVDLRVYVLVTSLHPLRVHIYRNGLARFGTEKYDTSLKDIDNLFSHLTNSSINKYSHTYDTVKDVIGSGAKWDFRQLEDWVNGNYKNQRDQNVQNTEVEPGEPDIPTEGKVGTGNTYDELWKRICDVVILTTLLLVQPEDTDPEETFFELFGFDVLVDQDLRPWVLEVNCAPALSIDCKEDARVKEPLLRDLFQLVMTESSAKRIAKTRQKSSRSGFHNHQNRPKGCPEKKAKDTPISRKPPVPKQTRRRKSVLEDDADRLEEKVEPFMERGHMLKAPRPSLSRSSRSSEAVEVRQVCPSNNKWEQTEESDESTNFELIFPFDEETSEAASTIFLNGLASSSAGPSSKHFTDLLRVIVNQVKKRRKSSI